MWSYSLRSHLCRICMCSWYFQVLMHLNGQNRKMTYQTPTEIPSSVLRQKLHVWFSTSSGLLRSTDNGNLTAAHKSMQGQYDFLYIVQYFIISHHIVSHYIVFSYRIISYYIVLHCILLQSVRLHGAVLYCIKLYRISYIVYRILYCIMSYSIISY